MAPITRLALVAALVCTAFVNAAPVLAPVADSAPAPALAVGEVQPIQKRAAATIITKCKVKGTVAITFDDGPHIFTKGLLDTLKKKKVQATFFVNGNNFGNILSYKDVLTKAVKDGHQIASHTYSHADLATLTKAQITTEMTKLEGNLRTLIGKAPTFMRPPYGSYNNLALETLGGLGYTVVMWDTDTKDFEHPTNVKASLDVYKKTLGKKNEVKKAGHIVLEHDVIESTSKSLAPQAIDYALSLGYKIVTVGACLGVPESKWYKK